MTTASPAFSTGARTRRDRRRPRRLPAVASLAVAGLVLAACGGGDDDDAAATTVVTTVPVTAVPTTLAPQPAATTLPPATTAPEAAFVTEGAVVVVANASGIDGAAGRLTDRLAVAGFTTGAATNTSDTVGQFTATEIHYVPGDADALAVAQSVKTVLGGGSIELVELGSPAPTESGELGGATVLVLMGNDVADRSLEELQGGVVEEPTTDSTDESTGEDTAEGTAEDT